MVAHSNADFLSIQVVTIVASSANVVGVTLSTVRIRIGSRRDNTTSIVQSIPAITSQAVSCRRVKCVALITHSHTYLLSVEVIAKVASCANVVRIMLCTIRISERVGRSTNDIASTYLSHTSVIAQHIAIKALNADIEGVNLLAVRLGLNTSTSKQIIASITGQASLCLPEGAVIVHLVGKVGAFASASLVSIARIASRAPQSFEVEHLAQSIDHLAVSLEVDVVAKGALEAHISQYLIAACQQVSSSIFDAERVVDIRVANVATGADSVDGIEGLAVLRAQRADLINEVVAHVALNARAIEGKDVTIRIIGNKSP